MSMDELQAALLRAGADAPAASRRFTLPGDCRPWTGTGIGLRRGQAYTLLGDGVIRWSRRHPHLYGGPGFHLWGRVAPGGRLVNVAGHSGSFVADVDGELELGIYLGAWRDASGALDTPDAAYARLSGALDVLVLVWNGDPADGLARLARYGDDPLLLRAARQAAQPPALPAGWDYLLETGTAEIYRSCGDGGHPRICLDARDDQGILRHPVDFPLTPATRLEWRWLLTEHPAREAEDSSVAHDYVSVAAEFDDGRDLTWLWSCTLPPGYHFPCPIPAWSARETHYVVRSGLERRGMWCAESRAVHADFTRALGPAPARITAIWLIAVATFHHRVARAAFEAIRLRDGARELAVL